MKVVSVMACLCIAGGLPAGAAWFRVGVFDVDTSLNSSLIYTSNADAVSDEEFKDNGAEHRDDLYLQYGFSFTISGQPAKDLTVNLATSLNKERHFIRTDADSAPSQPYTGTGSFETSFDRSRLTYGISLSRSVNTSSDREQFFRPVRAAGAEDEEPSLIPAPRPVLELNRPILKRNFRVTDAAGINASFRADPFSFSGSYDYQQNTNSKEFESGDTETQTMTFSANWTLNRYQSATYSFTRNKSRLINPEEGVSDGAPEGDNRSPWLSTQTLSLRNQLLKKPAFSYTISGEKEDDAFAVGTWELTHQFALSDTWKPRDNITFSVNFSYNYDPNPEEDDITFTGTAVLSHTMLHGWNHQVNYTREPALTFGSSVETDSTSVSYQLSQPDFILQKLSLSVGVQYEKSIPKGQLRDNPTTETTDFSLGLTRSEGIPLGERLNGNWNYSYSYENPDQTSWYQEHRLMLTLSFTL